MRARENNNEGIESISDKEILNYYKWQGRSGNHQKQMYESENPFTRWWQNKRRIVVESLIKQYNVTSLLDVGCAEGLYVRFISEHRSFSVGIDISKPKLLRAKSYSINNPTAHYVLADASNLPFRDNSFDIVICIDVIRYLKDPIKAVKELFRVSKKYVIIQSATSLSKMYSPRFILRDLDEVKREFRSNPFSGSLWVISSRSLEQVKYLEKTIKIVKQIGLLHFIMKFIFPRVNTHRKFFNLIDRIHDFLADKTPFNKLGSFTTILFEKKGE